MLMKQYNLEHLLFLQHCSWGFYSHGIWCCSKGQSYLHISCKHKCSLAPRVDDMSQDVVHIEHWKMKCVASKCNLITHQHGVISQKNTINTCVLHLPTGKPLPCLICGMPLCADLHASLHETCKYNHKNHMLKLHPQMDFSAMWRHLKGLLCLSMAGMRGTCSFKMSEYDAYFCLKATICTKKSVTCF